MATPNYSYEKRQRELAKKRKNEEKRQRKLSGGPGGTGEPEAAVGGEEAGAPAATPDAEPAPKPDNS